MATQPEKKITLKLIGEIQFDRSFSAGQFIDNEKERDKYYEKQEKSNPSLIPPREKNSLKNKFEELGFVKNEELLLPKFKFSRNKKCQLTNQSGTPVNVHFVRDEKEGFWKLFVSSGPDSTELKLDFFALELKYNLFDIIPGDYKEIVLLDEHYISNNELYNFSVYEIKTDN